MKLRLASTASRSTRPTERRSVSNLLEIGEGREIVASLGRESHEEVRVAARQVEIGTSHGRAKYLQPRHVTAERHQFRTPRRLCGSGKTPPRALCALALWRPRQKARRIGPSRRARHRFRPIVFNILKKDKSKLSLKRNRLKASVNPFFRTALLNY